MTNFNIRGKVVVITGGSGSLGFYFSKIFLKNNATVILVDVNNKTLKNNYNILKNKFRSPNIDYHVCNISEERQVNLVVNKILKKYKKIDVLVNNASTKTKNIKNFYQSVEDYKLSTWNDVMSVNLNGTFLFAQKVGNSMIKRKIGGSIIQMSSIYGSIAPDLNIYKNIKDNSVSPSPVSYMVSKSAIEGLTKYLASHWGKFNIRVNSISPGGVDINLDKNFKQNYIKKVPLKRMALPEDLKGIIIYLSSDLSSYVTGQNFLIDGGFSII